MSKLGIGNSSALTRPRHADLGFDIDSREVEVREKKQDLEKLAVQSVVSV